MRRGSVHLRLRETVVFEDGGGVGEEAAVPEVGAAAVEDVQGLGSGAGALEVEAEGAGAFVFAVDDDEVGRGLSSGAMAAASWREVRTGEKICRPRCAASRKAKVAATSQRLAAWGL